MSPGLLTAYYGLRGDVFRPAAVLLSMGLNVLIYSVLFALLLELLCFVQGRRKSQS